jgi:hypothetical protein
MDIKPLIKTIWEFNSPNYTPIENVRGIPASRKKEIRSWAMSKELRLPLARELVIYECSIRLATGYGCDRSVEMSEAVDRFGPIC